MTDKKDPGTERQPGTAVIRVCGDPVLKQKAETVTEINRGIIDLLNTMVRTMYAGRGVGLAAPQIGVLKRVIVVDDGQGLIALINPKIINRKGRALMEEGCLSVPGLSVEIKRSTHIDLHAVTPRGENVQLKAEGMLARIIQHEVDHLDGVLILDRATKKKLEEARKK